jgi:drug/metabolite transporter (DMT)-like permease
MELPLESQTTAQDRAHLNRGYTLGLIGIAFWSTTAIFISYLLKHYPIDPLTLAFWRNVFVTSALLVGLLIVRRSALRVQKQQIPFLLLYGVSLTLMNMSWTYSVAFNGAAVSTVLVYSSPGITTIAARLLFKDRLTPLRILAIFFSLLGCILVAEAYDPAQWNVNAAGIVIGILSAFGFTFYSIMGKYVFRRSINSWTATLYAFAIAAVALFFTQLGGTLFSLGTEWDGWLILFVLAVIPTLGGFGLYTASLGYLPAGTANLLATLEPVLTTLLAYLLLKESLSLIQFIGSGLIIASVISLRLEER